MLQVACSSAAASRPPPAAGLVLVGLADGAVRGQTALGVDPVAVDISADGRTAYVSDNAAGMVDAVSLPDLRVKWQSQVGGRPGPILAGLDTLFVSLYEAGSVVELDSLTGRMGARHAVGRGPGQMVLGDGAVYVACSDGRVWDLDGHSWPAGHGFGLAGTMAPGLWSADYDRGDLVRVFDGYRLALPPKLHPFWLSAGAGDQILVAAEGDDEDKDPGAVLAVDRNLSVTRLATARDPDHVVEWDQRIYVAAHGDAEVTVLGKGPGRVSHWLKGAAPVAQGVSAALGLLVVVTDARE